MHVYRKTQTKEIPQKSYYNRSSKGTSYFEFILRAIDILNQSCLCVCVIVALHTTGLAYPSFNTTFMDRLNGGLVTTATTASVEMSQRGRAHSKLSLGDCFERIHLPPRLYRYIAATPMFLLLSWPWILSLLLLQVSLAALGTSGCDCWLPTGTEVL